MAAGPPRVKGVSVLTFGILHSMEFLRQWWIRAKEHPTLRAFQFRDFRLLWCGAFLSFTGTWIQNVAQGWLVYQLTGDPAKLALVGFANMAPIALLGPFAGTIVDSFNKRKVLVGCLIVMSSGSLFLFWANYREWVEYWHILVVAAITGTAGALEIPTRQSMISRVVPPDTVAAAIPVNAMTFNLARVLGPAIGGELLSRFGPERCYLVNGISFFALVFAALAIRADLKALPQEPQPIKDLLFEGMRYMWRQRALRTLFLMECTVSTFALFYLPMMPAIAKDLLKLDKRGLGHAMTSIGVGAMIGLITLLFLADRPWKARIARYAMASMGICLLVLATVRVPWVAFVVLAIAGASGVMQFNTTNTLFQTLSPDRLRGRVISMHVWALSGLGPITLPLFGYSARMLGIPQTLAIGGSITMAGAGLAWVHRGRLKGAG